MTWKPNIEAKQQIDGFVEDLFSTAPEIMGIDEIISGSEIINMNPDGDAPAVPRYITIALGGPDGDGYYQAVYYRGFPAGLVATDFVTVVHLRAGNRYEILTAGGPTGIAHTITAGQWLDIGAVANSLDFEPDNPAVITAGGVVTEYATIQAAITAAGAGEYVVIPPGTYDEAITLKNGVIVTELFPDTVVINHTTSDVAVTTATGGFLRVKEIRVTRANNNIRAVLSSHAAGICVIYARLIRAENAGTGGTIGVFQTGAGTLFVYCDDCQASGGDDEVIGAACDAGIQCLRGDCLAENGVASYSLGAECDGGTQRIWGDCTAIDDDYIVGAGVYGAGDQIVRGHCTAETAAAGSWACGAHVMNAGTVQVVYGECSGLATDDAMGADIYQGTQTIHGNCFAEVTDTPADSYGARVRNNSVQTVWGNCTATGGDVSIGAYCQVWAGAPVQRVNGDVTGDFHGALCSAGVQTITNSRASGGTADLERTGGILQAFSVQHDTVVGTITWLDGDALESLRDYAQGSIIRGGAVDWEALAHPGAAGYALVSTAVDTVWDQTPTWTGAHTFNAGLVVAAGQGITLRDPGWIGLGPALSRLTVAAGVPDVAEFVGFGQLNIENVLGHIGDADTYLIFSPDFAGFRVGNVDFLYMDENGVDEFEVNPGGVDLDFIVQAVGVADALLVQGSDGQITLGALTAGFVKSSAGGVLSVALEVALAELAGYAQGSIIRGGAADWEALAHPGAAGYALVSNATDIIWDQTPAWTGEHSFGAGIAFTGASGANEITVPAPAAIALEILDTNAVEYVRINSVVANPYFLINPAGAAIQLGVGTAAPDASYATHLYETASARQLLKVEGAALDFTAPYIGAYFSFTKTAGASDHDDTFTGTFTRAEFNQAAGEISYFYGGLLSVVLSDGNIGDVTNSRLIIGQVATTDLDAGKVWGDAEGLRCQVDQEAANEVTGNIYGIHIWADADGTVGGEVRLLYLNATGSNVDYGVYQAGAVDNYFAGDVGVGVTPGYQLDVLDDRASDWVAHFFNDGNNVNRYGIAIRCGADNHAAVGTTYFLGALGGDGVLTGCLKTVNGVFSLADISDSRNKVKIKDTKWDGLEVVNGLRVRDFNWKANPEGPVITGFVAQEVLEVYPDMIGEFPDGTLNISQTMLVPIFAKAIQELDARLTKIEK